MVMNIYRHCQEMRIGWSLDIDRMDIVDVVVGGSRPQLQAAGLSLSVSSDLICF